MKSLYLAALAMAMTACSQEELVNEVQLYTLDAEIVQSADVNSRVNIGDRETPQEGKPFSRVNWEAGDTFCAFNATTDFANAIEFTMSEGQTEDYNAIFTATKAFTDADITYAIYPKKRFKGLRSEGSRVMLALPKEQNMSESQDAVMLGTYNANNKKIIFKQTMVMLEIELPAGMLEGNVCLQIEANRAIAAKNNEVKVEVEENPKVEILKGKGTNTITLFRNGSYAGNKVYCAVPSTDDYKWIKVSKGTYTEKDNNGTLVRTATIDATPLTTVKANTGTFALQKKIYKINCTSNK